MTNENIAENQFVITRKRAGELLFLLPKTRYAVWTNDIQKAKTFSESEIKEQEVHEDEKIFPASEFEYIPFNK